MDNCEVTLLTTSHLWRLARIVQGVIGLYRMLGISRGNLREGSGEVVSP